MESPATAARELDVTLDELLDIAERREADALAKLEDAEARLRRHITHETTARGHVVHTGAHGEPRPAYRIDVGRSQFLLDEVRETQAKHRAAVDLHTSLLFAWRESRRSGGA